RGAPARRAPALRRAALPAGSPGGARQSRGARCSRVRPVRQGQPVRGVLADGPARQAIPAQPERPLQPRPDARLDRRGRRRPHRVPQDGRARAGDTARQGRQAVRLGPRARWDRRAEEMSRPAYSSVRPACKSSAPVASDEEGPFFDDVETDESVDADEDDPDTDDVNPVEAEPFEEDEPVELEITTDSLQLFLKDIGKVSLLTAAQEVELAKRI